MRQKVCTGVATRDQPIGEVRHGLPPLALDPFEKLAPHKVPAVASDTGKECGFSMCVAQGANGGFVRGDLRHPH